MAVAAAFLDPVHDAQACFRAVMNALARPGTIHAVTGLAEAPAPLSPVAAAIALALADYETQVFLDARLAAGTEVGRYIAFHTGARLTAAPSQASFALIADPALLGDLAEFALGTDTYPDRSTTLVLQVDHLAAGAAATPPPGGGRSAAQQPGEGDGLSPACTLPLTRPSADLSPAISPIALPPTACCSRAASTSSSPAPTASPPCPAPPASPCRRPDPCMWP
jgi:alpha-D-ribose 1-methylphosphonate 5-triphosphate synthase subunit PhnH